MIQFSTYATTAQIAAPVDFVRILLGEASEAEVEERYLALARALLLAENSALRAA